MTESLDQASLYFTTNHMPSDFSRSSFKDTAPLERDVCFSRGASPMSAAGRSEQHLRQGADRVPAVRCKCPEHYGSPRLSPWPSVRRAAPGTRSRGSALAGWQREARLGNGESRKIYVMSSMGTDRLRVAATVLDDISLFELAVTCEVFGRDHRDLTPRWYELTLCRTTPENAIANRGLRLVAPAGLDTIRNADLVIVPACGNADYQPPEPLLDELRRAHRRGVRIAALCTGAFVLAAAGLLDGREAATHWMGADELRRRYPRIRVNERALYVDDGEILTSAGTAAAIDLCLHIVRRDFGAAIAADVARSMVIAPHREGNQAQYVPSAPHRRSQALATVLDWAARRLHEPLTVPQLAQRAAMSTRTFERRFAKEVGITPRRWLNQQRLAVARQLLESTDLPIDTVAQHAGLRSGTVLRQHFHRELDTTPAAYRRAFHRPTTKSWPPTGVPAEASTATPDPTASPTTPV